MWVFAYGSLIYDGWERDFHCQQRLKAELRGFRRVFNKASTHNWGTRENPGPTLNIEEDASSSCAGIAFQFAEESANRVEKYLRCREGSGFALEKHPIKISDDLIETGLVPICRNETNLIQNKSHDELAAMALRANGRSGRCVDYATAVARALMEIGIDDRAVQEFQTALNMALGGGAKGKAPQVGANVRAVLADGAVGERAQSRAGARTASDNSVAGKPDQSHAVSQKASTDSAVGQRTQPPVQMPVAPSDSAAEESGRPVADLNTARDQSPDRTTGVLSVEVRAPLITAGRTTTVTLIIRNPFPHQVVIESIQAPSSPPLLPNVGRHPARGTVQPKSSLWNSLLSRLTSFQVREIALGPLVASFPTSQGRTINLSLAPKAKLTFKSPLGPHDRVNISSDEASEIIFDMPPAALPDEGATTIPAYQEDIATFELPTKHWLFVTPKTLDLYAVIRYQVGSEQRSQIVPFSVAIRPPLTAIVIGSVAGGCLGYAARQLTSTNPSFSAFPTAIAISGVVVMAIILAIVLSRQESAKGFVTLEDFYGAFVVGVLLGYSGTTYFDQVLKGLNTTAGTAK